MNKRLSLAITLLMSLGLLPFATARTGGDSSGGGNDRALHFRKSAHTYAIKLKSASKDSLKKNGITVTAADLEKAVLNKKTDIRILTKQDNFSLDPHVKIIDGHIFENENPKTAYYSQKEHRIFVGADWVVYQGQLALKEFLRTMGNVDAEEQAVKIASWVDLSHHAYESSCAVNQNIQRKGYTFKFISRVCLVPDWDQLLVYTFDEIAYKEDAELWALKVPTESASTDADAGSALAELFGGIDLIYVNGSQQITGSTKVVTITQTNSSKGKIIHQVEFNTFELRLDIPGHEAPFVGHIGINIEKRN